MSSSQRWWLVGNFLGTVTIPIFDKYGPTDPLYGYIAWIVLGAAWVLWLALSPPVVRFLRGLAWNPRVAGTSMQEPQAELAGGDAPANEGTDDENMDDDIDPVVSVDCRDGREAVLMLTADRYTKLKAQVQVIAVRDGEIERGDPYPASWRAPGTGGYTTEYQELRPGMSVSVVLARAYAPATYMMRTDVYLDLLGDGGLIQRIAQPWPKETVEAEVSVNVFGGKVGRLVHAFHYILTARRGSNVITVRPIQRPTIDTPAPGVELGKRRRT